MSATLQRALRLGASVVLILLQASAWLVLILMALAFSEVHAQTAQEVPPQAAQYQQLLRRTAQLQWGLDAPVASFAAQVHQESRWRANARSPVGAMGLTQFMPGTAAWIGQVDAGLAGAQPFNPTWSLRALVTYDRWLWQRVTADDDCERMAYVLSAYNGGLGWVYKRQKLGPTPGRCMSETCAINPGISPAAQAENQHYPELILQRYEPLYATWGRRSCQP